MKWNKKLKKTSSYLNEVTLIAVCLLPQTSHASSTVISIFNSVNHFLSGPLARISAGTAILAIGYLTVFAQKLPKDVLIYTCIGLSFIFGSDYVMNNILKLV